MSVLIGRTEFRRIPKHSKDLHIVNQIHKIKGSLKLVKLRYLNIFN